MKIYSATPIGSLAGDGNTTEMGIVVRGDTACRLFVGLTKHDYPLPTRFSTSRSPLSPRQ